MRNFYASYNKVSRFKTVLFTLFVLFVSIELYAVSAYPGLMEIKQPDGYLLKVRMIGDEYDHRIESEDGYTLLYDDEGYLTLAMRDSIGELLPSNIRLRNVNDRTFDIERQLQSVGKHATFSEEQQKKANARRAKAMNIRRVSKPQRPVVGVRRFLVVLMEFTDVKFKHSQAEFHALMNEEGYKKDGNQGSVHDYYRENSFGQLDLKSDVAGVYQAKHEMAYYGNNNTGSPEELAIEAMEAAAADYDLKQYDGDDDGYIDGLHIIFAGYGEEAGANANCIWSHEANTSGTFCTVEGVKMRTYSCTPELRGSSGTGMSYIGVICHEIGHALGTPDFYDVDYAASGGQYTGTGDWDVMANGSWNGDGACPAHFNPYSKIYDFRWSGVNDGNKAISTKLEAKKKDDYLRIDTKTESEFFLLEYRSQAGFDREIPGHGLMVWRGSEGLSKWSTNKLNAGHRQQFYPLSANSTSPLPNSSPSSYGNTNSSSTPFPGTGGVTKLTDETSPSMKSWEGVNTDCPITNINEYEVEGYVELDINGGDHGDAYGLTIRKATTNTLDVTWGMPLKTKNVMLLWNSEDSFGIPNKSSYAIGESIEGGGQVLCVGSESEYLHQDLQPHTYYYYRVCTWHQDENAWHISGTRIGKTKPEPIVDFPFVEDFESQKLDESWEEETVFGKDKYWSIKFEYIWGEPDNYCLEFKYNDLDEYRNSRLILPIMNFEGKNHAILSFDYRNSIKAFMVMYRTSPDSEWMLLKKYNKDLELEPQYDIYGAIYKRHTDLILPSLSKEYQICFIGESDDHNNLLIDNIQVHTDMSSFVSTLDASFVNSTSAKISYNVIQQENVSAEIGVEYSTDQSSWIKVTSMSSPCTLQQLTANTKYYYRAFSKTADGIQYGNIKTFKTLPSFSNGEGSKDNPYQIASIDDWRIIRDATNDGIDFKDIYFVLKTSLTLSTSDLIKKLFSGTLDGDGYTLSFSEDGVVHDEYGMCAFIETIGEKGVVHHINSTTGPLVKSNHGIIHNCDVDFDQTLIYKRPQFSIYLSLGLISDYNYGIIHSCHAKVDSVYIKSVTMGGICNLNVGGIIALCTFEGSLCANNNSSIGGIVGGQSQIGEGIITRCVNKGKMYVSLADRNRAWLVSAGGIAGYSYGLIDQCVNNGDIIAECQSSDYELNVGGITGRNDHSLAIIQNCYQAASIITKYPNNEKAYGGGIVGNAYISNVFNCLSIGDIYAEYGWPSTRNAIVGYNNMSSVDNCFYTKPMQYTGWPNLREDPSAQKVDPSELNSHEFVNQLNSYAQVPVWQKGAEHPVLAMESEDFAITTYLPTNIFSTEATLSGVALGNVNSCGMEWKAKNDSVWNTIPMEIGFKNNLDLEGLTPATLYEYRMYAETASGRKYSKVETFATEFVNAGSAEDPIGLWNYNDLVVFRETVHQGNGYKDKIIKLMSDIDLQGDKGVLWNPITEKSVGFGGEFDGNGHIVRNMKIVNSAASAGFFGTTQKCYVHDLTILNGDILNTTSSASQENVLGSTYLGGVGGIIGDNVSYAKDGRPLVERCSFTGTIEGGNCIGGIVGGASECDVVNCYAIANLRYSKTGSALIGGIVGKGYVRDCYFAGSITAPSASQREIGRLIGDEKYIATNSYYQQSDEYVSFATGESFSALEMKNGTLLGKLSSEVWCADNTATPINQGYPVLISQSAPHLTITGYEITDDGIYVKALFYGAERNYSDRGFEFTKYRKQTVIEKIHAQTSLEFVANIPCKSGEYIAFRAFARENESIIAYSEWIVLDGEGGYVLGDANFDGVIDIADAVSMVNYIHERPSGMFIEQAADLNDDGEIDVFDVMMLINMILNNNKDNTTGHVNYSNANESINLTSDGNSIMFGIDNPERFTSFQFDLEIPQGMQLMNVEWGNDIDGHSLKFAKTGPGRYTVIALSMNNELFAPTNTNLLKLNLFGTDKGTVHFNNVMFVSADAQTRHFNSGSLDIVTNIESLEDSMNSHSDSMYDLQGRKINNPSQTAKGLYIIGDKKVVIK